MRAGANIQFLFVVTGELDGTELGKQAEGKQFKLNSH